MTTLDPPFATGRARAVARLDRADGWLPLVGLPWLAPLAKAALGEDPRGNLVAVWRLLGVPMASICAFLALWAVLAPQVQTSLGAIPGPAAVWSEAVALHEEAVAKGEQRATFEAHVAERNAKLVAEGRASEVKAIPFTGAPTFYSQVRTSIVTVFAGFLLASLVAIPLGILAGLSPTANAALNPLIQVFKPVSPLAWLPIVTMVVSATAGEGGLPKSFLVSAITVTLCSLWPTLINTALGVASIDRDLVAVSRVLRMGPVAKITRLVLPSAMPLIFTGLRLSLGVGWMVLIAAEMLSQNPGLGKFVWDEFQNGSSRSLARIMVAVLAIGLIGFALDRVMQAFQALVTIRAGR